METNTGKVVRNSDNNPLFKNAEFDNFCLVNEVNGADAEEVPQYVPTRHELVQMVKYWYGRILRNDHYRSQFDGSYSDHLWVQRFAPRRIRRAAAAIGQEAVDQAIEEAREEFKEREFDLRLSLHVDQDFRRKLHEQPEEHEEFNRKLRKEEAADARRRLEDFEEVYPNDTVLLVLGDWPEHKRKPVLVSATWNPKLAAVLQASGEFVVEKDKSKIMALADQEFKKMGFLRIRRENGEWRFSGHRSAKGTIGWKYLRWLVGQIEPVLEA